MIRVLIACEYSAAVRNAFTALGHYARSCDLLATESQQPVRFRHEFGCLEHARYDPTCEACEHDEPHCHLHDMPAYECSCLGPTEDEAEYTDPEHGARHLTGDLFSMDQRELESYDLLIAHPPCTHLAVSGARWLTRHWVKRGKGGYWHDPADKLRLQAEAIEFVRRIWALPVPRKCLENPISRLSTLWMKPTQIIQPWQFGHGETKATCLWLENLPKLRPTDVVAGREARVHNMPPGPDRWKERSRTFAGVARAMAMQWGGVLDDRAAVPARNCTATSKRRGQLVGL